MGDVGYVGVLKNYCIVASKALVGALRGGFRREEVEHQTKPAPNTPYATFPRFPIPDSRFPIPDSRFPIP